METDVTYNHEYKQKLKVCFIGAGGHSFRNVYPAFQYAPVDLAAIADLDETKGAAYARQFGARRVYADFREMLRVEQPDAVFIVTSYHPDGRVQATEIAQEALGMGVHVWMEKPAASSVREVQRLIAARDVSGKHVMIGTKKIFFPAVAKVKQIMTSPEFGKASSIYIRYPQSMPPFEERKHLTRMLGLLDHLFHPASVVLHLMGRITHLSYEWEPHNGGSVTGIRFASGAVGMVHLAAGISGASPLERLEVVGEGANVVIENGVKLTYYRKAQRPKYGRSPTYLVDEQSAPLYWEPEFSLGNLNNKNLFYLGYVQEIVHFCESVLTGASPTKGTLEEALDIVRWFEAYRFRPPGETIVFDQGE